jgi:hypothetical protein
VSDYTVGQIVDRCLNVWLLGTYSSQYNQLDGAVDGAATELDCALGLGEIGRGSYIALDDELCYVAERDATNNRLIVVRGVRGTLPSAHRDATPIEVNPRFPRFMIREVIREELDAWPDTLYKPKTIDATAAAMGGVVTIDGETDDQFSALGVIRVRRASLSPFDDRHRPSAGYEVQGDWEGEGGTIQLAESVDTTTTYQITLACKMRAELVLEYGDDCDLVEDVGLVPGMCEILELGAAYRLLVGRGSVRLFPEAEGQSRVAQEVGARDIPAFANSLMALRQNAMTREVERLYRRYGFGGG